ncbi:Coenzyme F420-dependent N5,N10-methylene tetrahydromethanopterin reductase and related flavin-dependent oxidoreductases [plant metagenome]|uniref:Coenzyme F420-dependent N5,N10-methylene tetrahydromethanopterin reductase and related flavin-dependent oxidoreductases n=1 Tax=plant metagenome TaxID=1297885 RepID=A0A484T935_9ZZZZ
MKALRKPLVFNAFSMNSVGHINHGLWTHPRDRSADYRKLDYWTDLARTLERGLFDGLFIADIVGAYDTYGQSADLTLRESVQLPINDPMLIVPPMAAVTRHLGFGVTVNLSYEAPYLLARRFSTLDHLTEGRVGWNIVTGYLDSAARAMGRADQIAHDERYDRADEYLEVLYKLWEGSWEDGAVRRDKAGRVYADPARVHRIRHAGRYFNVEGYHLAEPSPQRTPVLFQAGSSGRGLRFAARHAECVFVAIQDRDATRALVRQLHEALTRAGRAPQDVRVLMGVTVVTGKTAAQAREKYEDYRRHASAEAGVAHLSATAGIDFSRYGPDTPIVQQQGSNGIQNAILRLSGGRPDYTLAQLFDELALGGRYVTLVGDPQQIADQLEDWANTTGIDGFNLARTVVPESFEDFVDLVVPVLQERGLYRRAYGEGSLRHRLFDAGDRLPAGHVGAGYRAGALATP